MTFEQIGQQLRTARDTLGLSLNQIQERTKIPFNHLQAIDNGQIEELPEPVYVTGFIKRYAECVGLDGQRLADQYKEVLEGGNDSNGRFNFFAGSKKDTPHTIAVPAPVFYKTTRLAQQAPNPLKSLPFYAFWVIVVLSLVTYLVSRQQNNDATMQDPSVLALRQSTEKLGNLPPPTSVTTESPAVETSPQRADARITLIASQTVRAEVKSVESGETVFTGVLERGDRKDFQDAQGLRVWASNGGGLTVERDGKSQTLGEPGKKVEKVFLAKNATENGASEQIDSKTTTTAAKPNPATTVATTPKKPVIAKKPAAAPSKEYRKLDGMSGRRELPGESLGGGQGIDVPYRY
jgi:cytoskeletal protein RodZ